MLKKIKDFFKNTKNFFQDKKRKRQAVGLLIMVLFVAASVLINSGVWAKFYRTEGTTGFSYGYGYGYPGYGYGYGYYQTENLADYGYLMSQAYPTSATSSLTSTGITITVSTSYLSYARVTYGTSSGVYTATTTYTTSTATSTNIALSGLTPNTTYYYRSQSKDIGNHEYLEQIEGSFTTLANVPTSLTGTANSQTQITISWSANSNPAGTQYYAENTTAGTNSGWITNTSWSSSGLSCGTSYSFRVKAKNSAGQETDFTSAVVVSTQACSIGGGGGVYVPPTPQTTTGVVTATPSAGGKTTLTNPDGTTAAITVPANAITANTTFTITPATASTLLEAGTIGSSPVGWFMVGTRIYQITAVDVNGNPVTNFSQAITLTFTYTDDQIAGLDENALKVYMWDGVKWVALASTVNSTTNTITATTTHLTYFAIMSQQKLIEKPITEMTVEELRAEIARITALIKQLQAELLKLRGCTITSFDRNLKLGMSGNDVKCLQIILNFSADTQIATAGAGSPGAETTYFGPLTKAAVIKFQKKYASEILAPWGLTAGTGFVGKTTRAKLNTLLGK
jgi:hypothetical protein